MGKIRTHCYRCGTDDPEVFLPRSGLCRPSLKVRNETTRLRPGQCHRCKTGDPAEGFSANGYCVPCWREYQRVWHATHRGERNADSRSYYWRNRDEQRAKHLAKRREEKRRALEAYGGRCACCGEDRFEFLALDHINGQGKKHRMQASGVGAQFYIWLRVRGYPQGDLRVLCANCNVALGLYGYCPHRADMRQEIPTGIHLAYQFAAD